MHSNVQSVYIFHPKIILGGITGVFEVEELVDLLKRDNAEDIFVCSVPKSYKYVDYICVTSGRSFRHMSALAQFVRRVYKMKRGPKDILPRIEGEKSKDWMAMDLGNTEIIIILYSTFYIMKYSNF